MHDLQTAKRRNDEATLREEQDATADGNHVQARRIRAANPDDLPSSVAAYEDGKLGTEEVIELFQHLVDTGLASQLQGHYGRVANWLIRAGLVHTPSAAVTPRSLCTHVERWW